MGRHQRQRAKTKRRKRDAASRKVVEARHEALKRALKNLTARAEASRAGGNDRSIADPRAWDAESTLGRRAREYSELEYEVHDALNGGVQVMSAKAFQQLTEGDMTEAEKELEIFVHLMKLDLQRLKPLEGQELSISARKTNYIRELLSLARETLIGLAAADTPLHERQCFSHPIIRDRVREIGEEWWELTREEDPEHMYWFFTCDLLSVPGWTHQELAEVWDGIGEIRA